MLTKNEFLKLLGIPCHIKGFNYISDAIDIMDDDTLMGVVYIDVGKKRKETASRVERAIRHAIEISYPSMPENIKTFLFGNVYIENKPVNSLFIKTLKLIYESPNELKKFENLINNSNNG